MSGNKDTQKKGEKICKNCGKEKECHLDTGVDLFCTNSQHDNRRFELK